MVVAALVFGISAVVLGATVVDAVRVDPEVTAAPELAAGMPAGETVANSEGPANPEEPGPGADQDPGLEPQRLQGIVYPKVTETEILGAVNQDLFQPDRTPSLNPYLLPSERPAPRQESRNNRRVRQPDLRLVGTAIAGDVVFALIQTEDSLPVVFMLGETVEGFTLASVTEESMTLTQGEAEFTYPVVEPDRPRQSNNNSNNNARGRNTNANQDAAALQQRLQQAIQGMQQGGRGDSCGARSVPGQGGVQVIELGTSATGRQNGRDGPGQGWRRRGRRGELGRRRKLGRRVALTMSRNANPGLTGPRTSPFLLLVWNPMGALAAAQDPPQPPARQGARFAPAAGGPAGGDHRQLPGPGSGVRAHGSGPCGGDQRGCLQHACDSW